MNKVFWMILLLKASEFTVLTYFIYQERSTSSTSSTSKTTYQHTRRHSRLSVMWRTLKDLAGKAHLCRSSQALKSVMK
jgi:hypothetical protein